jgi:hypothetical protein
MPRWSARRSGLGLIRTGLIRTRPVFYRLGLIDRRGIFRRLGLIDPRLGFIDTVYSIDL